MYTQTFSATDNSKNIFFFSETAPQWAKAPSFPKYLDHTQRRSIVSMNPLDELPGRRKKTLFDINHYKRISMPAVVFEPTIPAGERPGTYGLDRAATGTGN